MKFNIDERYNAVVVALKGNVMGGPDGAKLLDELRALKDAGKKNIVVDLSSVKFLNSSGLGMLISAMTTMRNAEGDVRLSGAADRIRSLLMVTKLITVFKNFEKVEEAVASYDE